MSDSDSDFMGPPRPTEETESLQSRKKRVRSEPLDIRSGDDGNGGDSDEEDDEDDEFMGPPRPDAAEGSENDRVSKRAKTSADAMEEEGEERKRAAEHDLHELMLSRVPNAQMYERSYMHRATVTHTLCTPHTNFVVTASSDGVLKWWKKLDVGSVEFVKTVRAHASHVVDMVCSVDGHMLVTVARSFATGATDAKQQTSSIKVFDVVNFDMINVINVGYPVACVAILDNVGGGLGDMFGNTTSIKYRHKKLIAVVESGTKTVRIYDLLQSFDDDSRNEKDDGDGESRQEWDKYRLQSDSDYEIVTPAANNVDASGENEKSSLTESQRVVARLSHSLAVIDNLPHGTPIHLITYNHHHDIIVTVDYDNVIDYWQFIDEDNAEKHFRPPPHPDIIGFRFKTQTDLYEFAKERAFVLNLTFNSSVDSSMFVTYSLDRKVRLFDFRSGKLLHTWDESLDGYQQMQKRGELGLENIDFGRRIAIEKEIMETQAQLAQANNAGKIPGNTAEKREQNNTLTMNVVFDASSTFIMYATMIGIKVINVKTKQQELLLGKVESTERFMHVALFQGKLKQSVSRQLKQRQQQQQQQQANNTGPVRLFQDPDEQALNPSESSMTHSHQQTRDPSVFVTAYKKSRFYIFTCREPDDELTMGTGDQTQRDVFNEKPSKEDVEVHQEMLKHSLPKEAIVHTSFGDIYVRLYGDLCPKAVENFCGLSEKGYYNNMIFHRVIKKFMVQTGDPNGNGTGGTSIWGNNFGDEFHPSLRFNGDGKLAMANAGPNTNGSQFFITTAATPWLDNKHTLFGDVIKGKDIVHAIEAVKTDKNDKPLHDVKLLNIEVRQR